MKKSVTVTESPWADPTQYAQMKALDIFETSLCPGCKRPIDVCAAETANDAAVTVDKHVCGFALATNVQRRMDEWENTEPGKRSEIAPMAPHYDDGLMYAPRPSTAEELAELPD